MSSLDDIIKQKADGHEAPVPPGMWEKIMPRKKKRRFVFWLWMLAGLMIAGAGIFRYFEWKEDNGRIISDQRSVTSDQRSETSGRRSVTGQRESVTSNQIDVDNATEKAQPKLVEENKDLPGFPTDEVESDITTKSTAATQHYRQRLRRGATTRIRIQPAETGNADAATAFNGNKPTKKDRPITKDIDKKITIQITPAETGEEPVRSNDNTLVKEKEQDEKNIEHPTPLAQKPPVPIVNETKKQDNSIVPQHVITPAAAPAKKKEPVKNHGLFLDISVMPFLPIQQTNGSASFMRSSANGNSLSEFTGSNLSSELEPSVAFRLQLRKSIAPRWDAGLGLQYAQLKQTVHLIGEETTTTYNTVNRLVTGTGGSYLVTDTIATVTKGTREISAVNSYRFISGPLFVQYKAGKILSFDFSITGGLFLNIYSHYSNSIEPVVTATGNLGNSKVGIDLYGGFRLSKLYGRRIALFAEPTARFNISRSPVKNSLLHGPIHQAGIAVGAAMKLK